MKAKIEFFKDISEDKIPIIRLTKSKDKTTGTGTFFFILPSLFKTDIWVNQQKNLQPLKKISLIYENHEILSNDINIYFYKGKPFLIKCIFLFKNNRDWFNFLSFMYAYSKETGLYFSKEL
jgi:photosystem II reaction center protein Psb28